MKKQKGTDMHEQLWAPWRLAYVSAPKHPQKLDVCFICHALTETTDRENLLLLRTEHSVVMLNKFPYNNGHLLIAPRAHQGLIEDMTAEQNLDAMNLICLMKKQLDALMRPDGYNVGLNLGAAAGAGLPGHLHWHIVPRWNGDTNFMPVLNDTKVIVQSLETLYDLLTEQLQPDH